jgi:hypothetical protein
MGREATAIALTAAAVALAACGGGGDDEPFTAASLTKCLQGRGVEVSPKGGDDTFSRSLRREGPVAPIDWLQLKANAAADGATVRIFESAGDAQKAIEKIETWDPANRHVVKRNANFELYENNDTTEIDDAVEECA